MYRIYISLILFLICHSLALGQTSTTASAEFIIIEKVELEGNKKTKDHIILREMDLLPGRKVLVKDLPKLILLNEKRILSTGLFNFADIEVKNWNVSSQTATIHVSLQENWYIYPAPIFELADRNFNVWWEEQNRSLDRVNYGIRLDHINTTGNYDRLKLKLQFGYTRKYEMQYAYRYLRNGRWGFETNTLFAESREAGYITEGNKTLFFRAEDDRKVRSRFRTGITLSHWPDAFFRQSFRLEFHRNTIDEAISQELNPDYFENGASQLRFFLFNYDTQYDQRILKLYPEGGYQLRLNIKKEGLGIFNEFNNMSLTGSVALYKKVKKKLIFGTLLKAKTNLIRNRVAFANNTGLGYGEDIIRGYELYLLDGTDWVLSKSNISLKIFESLVDNRFMPIRQFKKLDLKIYLRWMTDMGIVYEPTYIEGNDLNNRWLIGYGPAIDFIFFNTVWLNVEYNFNHLGEGGFFIKSQNSF
jgi:outer membrane protein assembly factor BamA